ncbi:hypothetical protein [Embleya sp. MST-111070]|uniref:hypothetical protein n=1 Tax=Embleya sp. MST-111070 TaxID=3398231 RepID=UPI003F73EF30
MNDAIFQASDLANKRTELLSAARSGVARVRDKDGTSLVMLPESQLLLLQSVSDWSRHLMRLTTLAEGVERPTVDQLGELAWLRAFDNEDLQEFVSDMKQCLVAAHADGDPQVLEDCLNDWRTTAKQLEDPLRRSVLLGRHEPSDFVSAPRPVDE